MFKVVVGDLLSVQDGIIVQQVNCQGVMGAGLALQIAKRYPSVKTDYLRSFSPDLERSSFLGRVLYTSVSPSLAIACLFGQERYGRSGVYTDYLSLLRGLYRVRLQAEKLGCTVHLPYRLGCGLAGGDWSTVSNLIRKAFNGSEVDVYIWKLK